MELSHGKRLVNKYRQMGELQPQESEKETVQTEENNNVTNSTEVSKRSAMLQVSRNKARCTGRGGKRPSVSRNPTISPNHSLTSGEVDDVAYGIRRDGEENNELTINAIGNEKETLISPAKSLQDHHSNVNVEEITTPRRGVDEPGYEAPTISEDDSLNINSPRSSRSNRKNYRRESSSGSSGGSPMSTRTGNKEPAGTLENSPRSTTSRRSQRIVPARQENPAPAPRLRIRIRRPKKLRPRKGKFC